MSFGTLYTHYLNPRSTAIRAIAKAHGLHLDIVYADKNNHDAHEALCKVNPLGQVPTFVGSDGYVLTECMPIALYITSQSDTTTLLGSSRRDYYEILKWMSFANSDFLPSIGGCVLPLIGRQQVIRKNGDDCLKVMHQNCKFTNDHLKIKKYLVGEHATLADLFMVSMLAGSFSVFHKVFHIDYTSMTRWFYDVYNTPMYKEVAGDMMFLDLPIPALPADENNSTQEKQGLPSPTSSAKENVPTPEEKVETQHEIIVVA